MAEDETLPEPDRIEGYPHPREAERLYGQDSAERSFLDAWQGGRLHHAWLLRGPRGVGKATLAYRIARTLIAQPTGGGLFGDDPEVPGTLDAPEDCPTRSRILARAEPRLFVLNRRWDAEKKRVQAQIPVDSVRAMRRFLGLSAADGGWRVVIVDSADEMNTSSANALLKFLEEPPPSTMFLMITHAPQGLLPTIRSRCRLLDLGRLAPNPLARVLHASGAGIVPNAETAVAELSGGSAGEALRLVANDGLALYAGIVGLLRGGDGADRAAMTGLAEQCAGRQSVERYAAVLSSIQILLARLARAGAMGTPPAEAAPGEIALMKTVAKSQTQASLWAEALARISATTRHAVAVNLDPAQCVIDTFLEIDATLGRARAVAT